MFVTNPLSARVPAALSSRRGRIATGAVALSAVVSTTLALGGGDDRTPEQLAASAALSSTSAPVAGQTVSTYTLTAFTPPEAQGPQSIALPGLPADLLPPPVAEALEAHGLALEHRRPATVRPVAGVLTSNFGSRWGAQHNGLDFGDPLGAPIHAVTDGTVIEAGPASGFGLWVRVQQDDGTVGVYGHVNEFFVQPGQQVRAGDVIATVGNRGQSTGPHLHYEVHDPVQGPVDPRPWLAARGIEVGDAGD